MFIKNKKKNKKNIIHIEEHDSDFDGNDINKNNYKTTNNNNINHINKNEMKIYKNKQNNNVLMISDKENLHKKRFNCNYSKNKSNFYYFFLR